MHQRLNALLEPLLTREICYTSAVRSSPLPGLMVRFSLPSLEEFEEQFRRKYGREMTAEERKLFELAEQLLKDHPSARKTSA